MLGTFQEIKFSRVKKEKRIPHPYELISRRKLYFVIMESSVEMPKFKENEKVLCYHDKLLYEVTIQFLL